MGDDWLKGELRGRVGMFPLAFVEIIEDVEEGEAPPPLPANAPPPADVPSMPTWDDEPVQRGTRLVVMKIEGKSELLNFIVKTCSMRNVMC